MLAGAGALSEHDRGRDKFSRRRPGFMEDEKAHPCNVKDRKDVVRRSCKLKKADRPQGGLA